MFKTKYRFVREEKPDGVCWYTERWYFFYGWRYVNESLNFDPEEARTRYVEIINNVPLIKKTIICSR